MSIFSRLLEQIVTLGQGERLLQLTTHQSSTKCVAAGDPALPCTDIERASEKPELLEINGRQVSLAPFEQFTVCGNSMLPQHIANGSTIMVRKLSSDEYKKGDFLVIQVDKEYYKKFKPKTIVYQYKLRKAMFRVEVGVDNDELIRRMKEYDYSAYLEDMQSYAIRKYQKARKAYPDKELMLSTTYHDGELKYSFHPVELIYGRAEILVDDNGASFLTAA